MEHPNAEQAREVFTATAAGNIAPAFDLMTDDYILHNDIGAGPWESCTARPPSSTSGPAGWSCSTTPSARRSSTSWATTTAS